MRFIIDGVSKSFGEKRVLQNTSFVFEDGKIYALLGRNGAGKTTLFNCINSDLRYESGSFLLEEGDSARKILPDDIGFVPSTPVVPDFLTGREFLRFFIDINRDRIDPLLEIDQYFDMVQIEACDRNKLLKHYSHGMKNKMQMLVNLIINPGLLLLDEPLTSLDVVVAEEMKGMLRRIKEGRIIILSTHILDLALDLCDEVVLLNHGTLQHVEKSAASQGEFRQNILAALREENHD